MKGGTDLLLNQIARRNGGVIRLGPALPSLEAELADAGRKIGPHSIINLLQSLVADGQAMRLARGVYVLADANGRYNPMAIGPRLALGPAYVSMWPVASRASLSYNVPRLVSVISVGDGHQVRHRILLVPSLDVAFYFHALSAKRHFGYTDRPLGDGLTAPVASTEKALVDMLWFGDAPDTPPSSELMEMWQAAAAPTGINPKLLVRHVIRMDSPALARRAGYLMKRFGMSGWEGLLAHRGTSKRVIPLFAGDPDTTGLPSNPWLVR